MAEYLSEEDMNTGEYISRDEALKIFHQCCDNCTSSYNGVMCRACADADAMDILIDIPAADVQPVNQWISVKDRLPDEDGWYLVYKHNRVRVAEWCKDCWYNESDLPIDDCAITHWQPLPEPPKEGDTNG
jgi:hypothetical protein